MSPPDAVRTSLAGTSSASTRDLIAALALAPDELRALDDQLAVDANAALRRGALFAIGTAVFGVIVIPALILAGGAGLWLPWMFSVLCLAASSALYLMARARRIRGRAAYAIMLPWVSLPTLFFLLCHLAAPGGAATFLTGPFAWLYFLLLVIAGLAFDTRLSFACAIAAAGGYALCAFLGRDLLARVTAPDPTLEQDLRSLAIYLVRAVMLLFAGLTVGVLGGVARRFTLRVLVRQRERDRVARLFGQYVSPEVADRLLEDPRAHLGERKEVVILFSDLRGFTTYGESAEPEEIVRRLNGYFDAMGAALTGHGGVIDKYIGDAVMSVFGGLSWLANPADAALRAALEMRQRLRGLNARWGAEQLAPFDNGIGIHLGDVVQGALGSEHRRDFTVIGDAVNTASRLEGLTKEHPFPILVSDAVRRRLSPELAARCVSLGEVKLKGRRAPLAIFGVSDG